MLSVYILGGRVVDLRAVCCSRYIYMPLFHRRHIVASSTTYRDAPSEGLVAGPHTLVHRLATAAVSTCCACAPLQDNALPTFRKFGTRLFMPYYRRMLTGCEKMAALGFPMTEDRLRNKPDQFLGAFS